MMFLKIIVDNLFELLIALVLMNFLISELLKFFNNKWRGKEIPDFLKDVYSENRYRTFIAYKKETYHFSVIKSTLDLAVILAMLVVGFAFVDSWLRLFVSNEILLSLLFLGVIGLASDFLSLPFEAYETFVIEQKYGFNKTTLKTFILDKLRLYMLVCLIGLPILYSIIWLYGKFGADFWWLAWIVISFFSILISLLYSNIIVPVFNKQTPLEEGELRDKIRLLSKETDFKLENIYVIDASERSTKSNAYFTGLGSKKRIVLYDTLIETISQNEILSILAHEIGHYKKKHTLKGLIASLLQTGFLLFLFSLIVESSAIYESLNLEPGFHIGMIIFIILYSPVSFLLSIFFNYFSRRHEFEADSYAVGYNLGPSLIKALKSLTSNNLSDLNPNPWFVKVYYSHPTLLQRIVSISKKINDKGEWSRN